MARKNMLKKAFQAIYDIHADSIFRFCYIRVSDREQSLDLTQEAFTRLWIALNKAEEEGGREMTNHKAYLFTVAHNLVIDWYRKKKSISLESLAFEDGEDFEPVDEMAQENVKVEAEGRFLLEKIKDLSPSYRNAVYLRFVEGLSPPDIAEILGISPNAASVRITRGIEELRKITGYEINDKI